MSALGDLIREKILWIIVSSSLVAGLIAAYGRERHDGRRPDKGWWWTRVYILPFLGIVTGWCVSRFNLTNNDAAMLSAILALLGYEAVRIITAKSKKGLEKIADKLAPEAGQGFHSLVDTDDKGRTAAHIEVVNKETPRRGALGAALRETYTPPPNEPLPPDMTDSLDKLDDANPDKI